MSEGDSAPGPDRPAAPRGGGRARLAGAAAVVAALGAGALLLARPPKATVQTVAPPMPTESQTPSVDDVIAGLETRLQDDTDDAEGWRMLGWSYFQNGRYADAADALRKANRIDPDRAETWSFMGEALVLAANREGQMPRPARRAFERALVLNPGDTRARYFRALAIDLAGQHRRALQLWFELLEDIPPDAPYAGDIRKVIRAVGERRGIEVEKRLAALQFAPPPGSPEAADRLDRRLRRIPADADGWIALMRARMALDQPRQARSALKRGLAAFRKDEKVTARLQAEAEKLAIPGATPADQPAATSGRNPAPTPEHTPARKTGRNPGKNPEHRLR